MTHLRQPSAERQLRGASRCTRETYDYVLGVQIASKRKGRGSWIIPKQATIAAALGCSRRSVGRAVRWLKRRGLLLLEARYYHTAAGHIRRASNRCFVFVASNVYAVRRAQRARLTGSKRRKTADWDISDAERAFHKAHKQKTPMPPKGQTAFLRAYSADKGGKPPI